MLTKSSLAPLKDQITNKHMRKTITKHVGPYEDPLAWYGHVTRSDGLTKLILQGTVEGRVGRKRGGLISRNGPANPSQRHKPRHTTDRSGES